MPGSFPWAMARKSFQSCTRRMSPEWQALRKTRRGMKPPAQEKRSSNSSPEMGLCAAGFGEFEQVQVPVSAPVNDMVAAIFLDLRLQPLPRDAMGEEVGDDAALRVDLPLEELAATPAVPAAPPTGANPAPRRRRRAPAGIPPCQGQAAPWRVPPCRGRRGPGGCARPARAGPPPAEQSPTVSAQGPPPGDSPPRVAPGNWMRSGHSAVEGELAEDVRS